MFTERASPEPRPSLGDKAVFGGDPTILSLEEIRRRKMKRAQELRGTLAGKINKTLK
jgi:hypothetical protein